MTATMTPTKSSRGGARRSNPRTAAVNERLLGEMRDATTKVVSLEDKLKKAKIQRDKLVKQARERDVPYNDIADATGMSISWINAALIRTNGHRPRAGRPRRRTEA